MTEIAVTANLQARPQRRLTTRDAARLMNVSERMIYKIRQILRVRPDSGPLMRNGSMNAHEAWRIAFAKPKPTSWDRLVKAFLNATPDEQGQFIAIIDQSREAE